MIGKTISHYRILEKLGEGGMGVVYKAKDTKLDRIVALKFLPKHLLCDEEAKTRFVHEAKAASALNHPNITTIYEIDEVEGECFICMEYIEGKSVKEVIKEKGFSVEETLKVASQVCEGLAAAHEKGIVHRDIKSDNIMLTPRGQVKIMDFGLAKLKGATKLTTTGTTLGTLQYMSPEQASREAVDSRSDIFSLGVVLYEMITGQLPFRGDHEAAVIYSIMNETPEPLARYKANVPEGLQRIVDKALTKDKEERYQHADDLLADLRREKKSLDYVKLPKIPGEVRRPKKKLLPFIVPASIVFVLVLVFLILKPFKFEMVPDKSAIAKENSLAIMYFENMVDSDDTERLGEIVTNLLITDLSESEYMRVVSSQRLYDILKLLGKEGVKVIDKNTASEVATKAGAKWMLLGNILQVEPRTVITTQLVDVGSGKIAASQRITGEAGEKIFSMVDKLTVEIKKDLSLPVVAQQEPDRSVADVTTHSPEAYRYYLEGIDYGNKYYSREAKESFKKALKYDSTFAMAYYELCEYTSGLEHKQMLAKAVKYSDTASQKEKHYIRIYEAYASGDYAKSIKELHKLVERYPDDKRALFALGGHYVDERLFEQALYYLNKTIEIDPLYKLAYNQLAYVYNEIDDFEKSIWAINKYISLAPDEPNPYDTRGDLYAWNGKLDQAIESYKKALEIKPDFYMSLPKLGHMYLFKREYAKAESCYKELASHSDKDTRSQGRALLRLIPLYQGEFEKALEVLDNSIAADKMEGDDWAQTAKLLIKAVIYREKDLDLALKEYEKYMEIVRRLDPDAILATRRYYVMLLAEKGDFERAQLVAEALKKDIEEKDETIMWSYWYAAGCIELSKGNAELAVTNFEKLVETLPAFPMQFLLAKAYLESGRLGEAVAKFEKALSRYDEDRAQNAIRAVKAYYLLGLAYEKSGWNKKAIENYEEFLDIWKDADPGIPEVEDAKKRLEKLRVKS
jgi:serine/threonine protein kinase/predicted Zn-dependent protease